MSRDWKKAFAFSSDIRLPKGVKINSSGQAEVDTIHGDSGQIEQVFLNFSLTRSSHEKGGSIVV